ncbi:hypothetical protein HK103_004266 [Boothiomyces macroporosus]|uniref:Uncharacterized protein n=1 Tax=Boothiomyces macroporosus TaxID=261099 RepID=A0AAD5Y5Y7_9FUNG|nr:hypothetical protein HK103_004266 [Boothiomyces macroporosus]
MVDFATVGPIIGVGIFVLLFGGLLLSFYLPENEENMVREDSYHKMKRRITRWQPKNNDMNAGSAAIQMDRDKYSSYGQLATTTQPQLSPSYSNPSFVPPPNAFKPPTPPAAYEYPAKVDIPQFNPTSDTIYPQPTKPQGYNTISTNLPYTNNYKNYNEIQDSTVNRKSQSDVGYQSDYNSTVVNEYKSQVGVTYRPDKPWEPVDTSKKVYKVPELLPKNPDNGFVPPTLL